MPKAISDADGRGLVCHGWHSSNEHVRGRAITRQRKGIATAVRRQSSFNGIHETTRAAITVRRTQRAAGVAVWSGIWLASSGQLNRASACRPRVARECSAVVEPISVSKTRDERHYDCPRRAPAGAEGRLEAGNRR